MKIWTLSKNTFWLLVNFFVNVPFTWRWPTLELKRVVHINYSTKSKCFSSLFGVIAKTWTHFTFSVFHCDIRHRGLHQTDGDESEVLLPRRLEHLRLHHRRALAHRARAGQRFRPLGSQVFPSGENLCWVMPYFKTCKKFLPYSIIKARI